MTAPLPNGVIGGRTLDGRFAKGNKGGPGNPYAKKVASFRNALINSLKEKDVEDIVRSLVRTAKKGDVSAAKFLFSYALGSAPSSDEIEEIGRANHREEMHNLFQGISTDDLVTYMRKVTQSD